MIKPIVLVEIDGDSRLKLLQSDGVFVGFVDRRVDRILTLWPEENQIEAILASLVGLEMVSPGDDDLVGSAVATIQRVRSGLTVVSTGPRLLTKLGEPA